MEKIKCITKDRICRGRTRNACTIGMYVNHYATTTCLVMNNNDSRMFRPVAIVIVGKAEINTSGSFQIGNQY